MLVTAHGKVKLANAGLERQALALSAAPGPAAAHAAEVEAQMVQDIWRVGCVMVEMATGSYPADWFVRGSISADDVPRIPAHFSEEAHSFVRRSFDQSSEQTVENMLRHDFLQMSSPRATTAPGENR